MHNFKYITVADLSTLLLMTFSTIVIVFTVVVYFYTIVIVVNFNYCPVLVHICTHIHVSCTYTHAHTHKLEKILYCLQLDVIYNYIFKVSYRLTYSRLPYS